MPAERTIHVVDDDAAVRRSLELLLGSVGFITVSYAAPDSFLRAAPGLTDGCVLLDVKMPDVGGLEVQAMLKAIGFALPIIVITAATRPRRSPGEFSRQLRICFRDRFCIAEHIGLRKFRGRSHRPSRRIRGRW